MASKEHQSPVPIRARLKAIEITGNLKEKRSHLLVISVDDDFIVKSEKKPSDPAPRWDWTVSGHEFFCHPSSTLKVTIYRKRKLFGGKRLVGELTGNVVDILGSGTGVDLVDKDGTALKVKIDLSVEPEAVTNQDFKTFMESIDANVSRMSGTVNLPAGFATIGTALQFTKKIIDTVTGTHPILDASWTILCATYNAVQEAELQDESVRELVEQLRETLGLAKERPDLLVVEGTTNVIEEIGRLSLKTTSLIYEYTKSNFARRAVRLQLSDDLKERVASCQKSCIQLREKFQSRIGLQINRKLDIIKNDQLAERIWQWLSAPDSSPNYNAALEKHQEGTFNWFLDGKLFRNVLEKPGFFWIKGTSGCGKTVLCSTIIKKVIEFCESDSDTSTAYAHFFFDGRDSQNELQRHDKLIRSLIRQLSAQCDGIPAVLVNLYGQGHQQPSISSLQDTLQHIIEGFDSVHIVIDSLDECAERKKTLPWIRQMISQTTRNLHMIVASRPERDITDILDRLNTPFLDLAEVVNDDISKYLDHELHLTKWDEDTRGKVKIALKEGAQGMFRWVSLQLIELRRCSNPAAVLDQLQRLPTGLDETYDRILSRIDERAHRTDATTFLRFLSYSIRPMTVKEIAAAATIEFRGDGPRYESTYQYFDENDVLEKCSSLISRSMDGTVKLAHFSVKEYLLSEHLHSGPLSNFHLVSAELSHSIISQTCLAYLLHFDSPNSLNEDFRESFPLALYAAQYWIDHTRSATIDESKVETSSIWILACRLFNPHSTTWIKWVQIWDPVNSWMGPTLHRKINATPLYYASIIGLAPVVQHLLDNGAEVNLVVNFDDPSALQGASRRGHTVIVEMLLKKGADVNLVREGYASALQSASQWGNTAIVKLLLANGADVNLVGGKYGSALQAASQWGNTAIVKLLLANGADVNLVGGKYGSALQAASEFGNTVIVDILLANGANVNLVGEYGSALQGASTNGHTAIIELLLANEADVNLEGGKYGSALQAASHFGHTVIVEMLLKKGADVNLVRGEYGSALQAASLWGHTAIVEMLLEEGADANLVGGEYGSALHRASFHGHTAIVHMLLAEGAEVNLVGGEYGSALQGASRRGHTEIVDMLLENGADVNLVGGEYGSALQAASLWGHTETVKLLLAHGADVNLEGGKYGIALMAATAGEDDVIVKLLQDAQKVVGEAQSVNASGVLAGPSTA